MIGEKRPCTICNREVEIISEVVYDDHDDQVLSCGHLSRRIKRTLHETISISNQLSASKTVKIEPVGSGTVPVEVSGETIPKFHGLLDFSGLNIRKEGDVYIIDNQPTIYYQSTHTETHINTSTTVINNLNDVLIQVDNSTHSSEEKDKIKQILKIAENEKSKPISEINSALSHLKTWIPIATPYLTMFLGTLFKT